MHKQIKQLWRNTTNVTKAEHLKQNYLCAISQVIQENVYQLSNNCIWCWMKLSKTFHWIRFENSGIVFQEIQVEFDAANTKPSNNCIKKFR